MDKIEKMKKLASEQLHGMADLWLSMDAGPGKGFGRVDGFGRRVPDAPRTAVDMGRVLYALSAAYRASGREEYRKGADDAFRYIKNVMTDPVFGGVFVQVGTDGDVKFTEKRSYEQAFCLYGLAEYVLMGGDPEALELAKNMVGLLEKARGAKTGYDECWSRDWSETVAGEAKARKAGLGEYSLDSQSHVIEAYGNLYKAWPDEGLRRRLAQLTRLACDKLFIASVGKAGQRFDIDWELVSDDESYGDNPEVSYFFYDAACAVGDAELIRRTADMAAALTDRSVSTGLDPVYGGLFDRTAGGKLNDVKIWWNQCEIINGCLNAYRLTGEERYLDTAAGVWDFIEKYMILEDGTWRARVQRDGTPLPMPEAPSGTVCPYHIMRTCVRTLETLK